MLNTLKSIVMFVPNLIGSLIGGTLGRVQSIVQGFFGGANQWFWPFGILSTLIGGLAYGLSPEALGVGLMGGLGGAAAGAGIGSLMGLIRGPAAAATPDVPEDGPEVEAEARSKMPFKDTVQVTSPGSDLPRSTQKTSGKGSGWWRG